MEALTEAAIFGGSSQAPHHQARPSHPPAGEEKGQAAPWTPEGPPLKGREGESGRGSWREGGLALTIREPEAPCRAWQQEEWAGGPGRVSGHCPPHCLPPPRLLAPLPSPPARKMDVAVRNPAPANYPSEYVL